LGVIEWAEKHGELKPGQTGAWYFCGGVPVGIILLSWFPLYNEFK
jgi:hypothetical protein